jgi:hypothetical protein
MTATNDSKASSDIVSVNDCHQHKLIVMLVTQMNDIPVLVIQRKGLAHYQIATLLLSLGILSSSYQLDLSGMSSDQPRNLIVIK